MTRLRLILLVVIWPICTMPAQAQLFRKKPAPQPPPPPAQRVPELVMILKNDPDERKRTGAAEELRDFDPQTFSEIIPVLIDAARNDPKVGVRMEAVSSLGRMRPVTREVGQTLEHLASEDSNLRARVHARTTYWKYHAAGYSNSSPSMSASKSTTKEPPLLDSKLLPPIDVSPGSPRIPVRETSIPRPLPTGPAFTTSVPQKPVLLKRPAGGATIVEDSLPPLPAAPTTTAPPLPPLPPPPVSAPPVTAPPIIAPPLPGPSLPVAPPVTEPPAGPMLPEPPPLVVPNP